MIDACRCIQCGIELVPDALPEGLCPKCLLAVAMDETDTDVQSLESASYVAESGNLMTERLIGQVLDGKYRLDKKLGRGGMGTVYKAVHLGTGRPVAIKVIAPKFMSNQEFIERFKREAKVAGLLRHPNVVNVTDFGFADADQARLAYLVMEYLNGCALSEMLKEKPRLPMELAVDIMEQICLAVDEAHKQSIIHRDLKPDNIWLEPNGRGGYNVKVLDFGLAKLREVASSDYTDGKALLNVAEIGSEKISAVTVIQPIFAEPETAEDISSVVSRENENAAEAEKTKAVGGDPTEGTIDPQTVPAWLTRAGTILGTPLYMSPEQCHGKKLNASSDIYSLGIIAYEMLAGETPFKGDMHQLIAKHSDMPAPPLREKRSDIPKMAANLIESALAKNPDERPASALAFATSLRTISEGEAPILRQAFDLYREYFSAFARISLYVYLPLIVFNAVLLMGLSSLSPAYSLLRSPADKVYLTAALLLFLFANTINKAVCARVIEQLSIAPSQGVEIGSALAAVGQKAGALTIAAAMGGFRVVIQLLKLIVPGAKAYIDYSLYAPVIVIEGKEGSEALQRSKALTERLRSIAIPIQIRNLFIGSLALFLFLTSFVLCGMALDVRSAGLLKILLLILIGSVPVLFLTLAHTPVAIASSLLYFKCRQAGAEIQTGILDLNFVGLSKRVRFLHNRTAAMLTILPVLFALPIAAKERVLILAAENGSANAVKALLAIGAQPEARGAYGATALISASTRGHADVVKALLASGADPNRKDDKGRTAFIVAAENGHADVVEELFYTVSDRQTKDRALMTAAERGYGSVIQALISAGADVSAKTDRGQTVLMLAAKSGSADAVKALIAAEADVTAKDSDGQTALTLATKQGYTDIIRLLNAETEGLGVKFFKFKHNKHIARQQINNRCNKCHDDSSSNLQETFRLAFINSNPTDNLHKSMCFKCHNPNLDQYLDQSSKGFRCSDCHVRPPSALLANIPESK